MRALRIIWKRTRSRNIWARRVSLHERVRAVADAHVADRVAVGKRVHVAVSIDAVAAVVEHRALIRQGALLRAAAIHVLRTMHD